jgi:hypothetical protein
MLDFTLLILNSVTTGDKDYEKINSKTGLGDFMDGSYRNCQKEICNYS